MHQICNSAKTLLRELTFYFQYNVCRMWQIVASSNDDILAYCRDIVIVVAEQLTMFNCWTAAYYYYYYYYYSQCAICCANICSSVCPSHMWVVSKLGMWRSSNSNPTVFELRSFSPNSKFDEYFKRFVVACEFVEKSLFYDWFHVYRQPASAYKRVFFSNSAYDTTYSNIWIGNIVSAQWCVTRY